MSRRHLAIALVNLILFVIFAESIALLLYYGETGSLFYAHRKTFRLIEETREGRLTGDGLHPYFGATHRAGIPFDIPAELRTPRTATLARATNNFGFVSPHAYPFAKTRDDQFVVGIFGGSVSVWFCQVGVDRLVEDLKQQPAFQSKEIVTLCFSHEGYKQPQQLQVLAYFLSLGQAFDLVVNIDGFNEVALGSLNDRQGTDISMPSAQHLDPLINLVDASTLTVEKVESLARINEYKAQLNRLVDTIHWNRVAAINFVLERYYAIVQNRYDAERGVFARLPSNPAHRSVMQVTPKLANRREAQLFEDIARMWARASMLMHDMLAARGVPYIHVLQPNQSHTRRTFSEDEARVALSAESPFKASVEKGYPVLLAVARSSGLADKVNFLNGVDIFDNEPAAVYFDNCCHYTLRGNKLLADFIAAAVGARQ